MFSKQLIFIRVATEGHLLVLKFCNPLIFSRQSKQTEKELANSRVRIAKSVLLKVLSHHYADKKSIDPLYNTNALELDCLKCSS